MKASYRDHLKRKFKPTFFGLFESQYDSLINNVYKYIYDEVVWSSPAITGCKPVSGGYRKITLAEIQGEFNGYRSNTALQAAVLERVKQYVADFEAATVFKPTQEQFARLLEVRNYFQENIASADVPSYAV